MTQYKILFVDEVDEDIRRFQRYVNKEDTDKAFSLVCLTPENTLDNFLNKIRDERFDAIITDHKLNEENSNISFDGLELVKEILDETPQFPCFILTSFDSEAVTQGEDVNIVYIKGLMNGDTDGDHANFLNKIEHQIKHYRSRISNAEKELLKLIEKSNTKDLNAKEEARLLELDGFIEKSTNKKSALPDQLKGTKNLDALHVLIANTDKLLEELKRENAGSSSEP
jgi:CheY-like chemotaxis protein